MGSKSKKKGGGAKSKHRIRRMHIRKLDDGNFHVEHEHYPDQETGVQPPSAEHAPGSDEELMQHVGDHLPMMGQAAPAEPAPAPAGGAGPAPGGM